MNNKQITPLQIAIRIMIIIVVIVILLLISFGIVRIVPNIFSSLSNLKNLFFAGKEKIVLSLDKTTVDQEGSAVLSYKQSGGKAEGFYTLTYSCQGIHSSTQIEVSGSKDKDIAFCDEPFVIGTAGSSTEAQKVTLTPFTDSISYSQPLKITVDHITASSSVASSTITLTIKGEGGEAPAEEESENEKAKPESKPEVEKEEEEETPKKEEEENEPAATSPSKPATVYKTPADFSVNTISSDIDNDNHATYRFTVTNNGGTPTANWRFTSSLPRSIGATIYESPIQPSIPGYGTSQFTLEFDNAISGIVSVSVDPYNEVREGNEGNNYVETRIDN